MKKNIITILLIYTFVFAAGLANASEQEERMYFAPAFTYIIADEDRKSDDGFGLSLGLGKQINEVINFEISAVLDVMARDEDGDYEQGGLLIDYLFFLDRNPGFSPYAVLGGGVMHTRIPDDNNTNAMGNVGAGFMTRLMDNGLRLRADARYRIDADSNSVPDEKRFGDWILNIGLSIPFGGKEPKPVIDRDQDGIDDAMDSCLNTPMGVTVNPDGCEVDSDGDGIADSMDQCSGTAKNVKTDRQGCEIDSDGDGIADSMDQCDSTPAGVKVDATGCLIEDDTDGDGIPDSLDQCTGTPAGAKVDEKGCEFDTDNDGIVDSLDQCANTATGAKVNENGCEFDTDNDGIVDSLDQCANTPAGEKVDVTGCEFDTDSDGIVDSQDNCADTVPGTKVDIHGCKIPDVVVLKGVNFQSGSTQLTDDSLSNLNDVAATLMRNPEMVVEISGYTDNTGSISLNRSLSQKRADSVREYLIKQGVTADNLKAKGYGPDNPIADNSTKEGRSQNRRVEMHILQR